MLSYVIATAHIDKVLNMHRGQEQEVKKENIGLVQFLEESFRE